MDKMLDGLSATIWRIHSITAKFDSFRGRSIAQGCPHTESDLTPKYTGVTRTIPRYYRSDITTSSVPQHTSFDRIIEYCARKNNIDPKLVHAVIKAESNYDSQAVSRAGAKGLMQLMDGTASKLGVSNPFDPLQNVEGGTRYLRQMLTRFGSVTKALAAYNAGPGAVDKYGGVPPYPETQTYVRRVLNLWG